MKRKLLFLLAMLLTSFSLVNSAYAITVKTVGPTGDFASITAALTNLQTTPATDALIWELQAGYTSAGETFPITFDGTKLSGISATNTLTIRPAANATGLTISNATVNITMLLTGASYVTIDGRPGGTGSAKELTISNTFATAQATVQLQNTSHHNTFRYVSMKGQYNYVVSFWGIGITGLNTYNTIDYCDVSNSGTGNLQVGIYSYSNTPTAQSYNQYNTISNCNIFDFCHAGNQSSFGIYLATGNSNWTITGNSIYQTAPRTMPYATYGIMLSGTNGSNFTISNNYIGGSAPNAGGTPWTISSGNASFYGMYFLSNSTTPNLTATVTNNTITNLDITNTNNFQGFFGMYVSNSSSGLITFTGNTIGSSSSTDAIVIRGGTSSTYAFNKIGNTAGLTFSNNTIGGITTPSNFFGVYLTGTTGAHTINGNTIGSATVANSIKVGTAANVSQIMGIYNNSNSANSISNNTIANLTNLYEGNSATGNIKGLYFAGSGLATVNGNTIFNLISKSSSPGTLTNAAIIGIHKGATAATCPVTQNVIYGLENQSPTGAVNIAGISITGISGSATVARNTIYGLSLSTSDPNASISGCFVGASLANFQNNDIRLGTTATGADITTGYAINGIHNNGGTVYYYFNTLSISGSNVSGITSPTYALNGASAITNLQNNLLINTRSGGVTGKHYALKLASAPTTMDNNDYFVAGGTGFLNAMGASDYTDLATWKSTAVAGKDLASLNVDPAFTSATNLTPTNGALVAGVSIAGITVDNAGTTRAAIPTMGAFEGAACSNPTLGGTIASAQEGCNPFDPALITSTAAASGQAGNLEYKWQQSTTSNTTGFADVSGENADTYNPGALTQTTWFKRLARVNCKSDWVGAAESNVVAMTVNPVPSVIASNTATICNGTSPSISLTASVPSSFTWTVGTITNGITGATSGSGAAIDQVLTNAGTVAGTVQYLVTPTSLTGTCAGTAYPITVTVNPTIPVSVAVFANQNPVCAGTTVNFFATATNGGTAPVFVWKVNGQIVGSNANNYAYAPAQGDVVTCELTSNVACPSVSPAVSNAVTMQVNENLTPSVTIETSSTQACEGHPLTFTATQINGGAAPVYQWKVNDVNAGTNSPTFTYVPTKSDVVKCVMTSNAPCASVNPVTSGEIAITYYPALQTSVSITPSANPVCAGTSVTFTTPTITGTTATYTYEWFKNTVSVGTGTTYTYVPVDGDKITVVMTSNATPCQPGSSVTSNEVVMVVNPILTPTVSIAASANPSCAGSSVVFTATPVNGGITPTYVWKVNNQIVGTSLPTYSYIPTSGDVVTCEVTPDATLTCPGSTLAVSNAVNMVVNPTEASVSIAADQSTVCAGTSVTFTATPTNGGDAPAYQWKVNNVNAGTNTATFTYTPANNDVVKCEMISSITCISTSPLVSNQVTLTVNPVLTASVTIAASANRITAGTSVTFTPTSVNGGTAPAYEWFKNGSSVGISNTYTYAPVNGDVIYAVMTSNATPCLANSTVTSNSVTLKVGTLPSGVVSYWHLDEAAGGTYVDDNGLNDGTGNVSPMAVTGQVSGAQQFNGTTTKIEVPASPTFDFAANGNFSVEFWYQGSIIPTSTKVVIGRNISASIKWYVGIDKNGRTIFYLSDGTTTILTYSNFVTDGKWHYITATRNGTSGAVNVYVDGVINGTKTGMLSTDFSSPTAKLEIGSFNKSAILNASLDEVAIHNVELSPSEILQHYNKGTHGAGYYSNYAPIITSIAPLSGKVGQLYSYDVNADGYPAPTYALTSSPAGMTINATTGLIQWTPSAGGSVNVTVEVSNGTNPVANQSFTIAVPTPQVIIPSGLVAYWPLNESAGNTYFDFTGTNNGTGNLSPMAVTGQVSGAQQFNGTTTKIEVPASPTFDFAANGNFSVEFWYQGSIIPTSTKVVIGRNISASIKWYVGIDKNGRTIFYLSDGTTTILTYSNFVTDGKWHYITATRNGTSGAVKVYVDAVINGTKTGMLSTDFSSPTAKLEIGSFNKSAILNASLDEVAIHNVELSLTDIQQHYTNGIQGTNYFAPAAVAKSASIVTGLDQTVLPVALKAYAYHNIEIKINGSVNSGAIATLYDIQGRMVFNRVLEEGETNSLPTPGIKTGIYILQVNDRGKIQNFKIPVRE